MLRRIPKWQSALDAFLLASKSRQFKYGDFDCCLFVADAIQAMTGTDIAAKFRGEYESRRQALRAGEEFCGGASIKAIVESVTAEQDMPEVPVSRAQRGDMVAFDRHGGRDLSLGLVSLTGREALIAVEQGWAAVPIGQAVRAWRV